MPLPAFAVAAALLLHAPDSIRAATSTPRPPAAPPATTDAATTTSGAALVADSIVVEKARHTLTLFHRGAPVRSYLVALGGNPVGDKVRAGDRRTPEGLYWIDGRNAESRYHLSLHISYPDAADRARAAAAGVSPGGDIMIHGLPNGQGEAGASHREEDWTNGCVAVTDEEIEEIWRAVPLVRVPIEIKP